MKSFKVNGKFYKIVTQVNSMDVSSYCVFTKKGQKAWKLKQVFGTISGAAYMILIWSQEGIRRTPKRK